MTLLLIILQQQNMATFSTNNHQYRVIQSLDPRPQVAGENCMSAGIFLIQEVSSGKLAVQKRLRMTSSGRQERVHAEVNALKQLQAAGGSRHLNGIIEAFWDRASPTISIILVYCDAGTIDDLIRRYHPQKKTVTEEFVWHVAAGMAKGLHFMHSGIDADDERRQHSSNEWNTICHLDIKPGNVFLSTTGQRFPRVLVGDFGCAVTKYDILSRKADRMVQHNGTVGWFPPEVHRDQDGNWRGPYGKSTDIWQLGGVIQSMCKLFHEPKQSLVNAGTPCGRGFSEALNMMVKDCMREDLDNRIQTATLVDKVRHQMRARGLKF